ncbi:MAG: TolC family protein [Acidobacteria bacterium]|nr:TolC family protein [Acidobacteriota bacterium]
MTYLTKREVNMRSILLIPIFMVAGCITHHADIQPPVPTLPQDYGVTNPSDQILQADWWLTFHDELLNQWVQKVLDQNPDLAKAQARLAQIYAEQGIVGADRLPQASVGLNASRRKQNFIGLPIPGSEGQVLSNTSNSDGLSFSVTWEVDLWGRLADLHQSAKAQVLAGEADWYGVKLALTAQTVRTYFSLVEAQNLYALAQRSLKAQQAQTDWLQQRFNGGLRNGLDLRFAQANLANTNALISQRKAQVERLERSLQVLAGSYPEGEADGLTVFPALPDPVPAGLPAELISRRPDLVAADQRLRASGLQLDAAYKNRYPRLSLSGSYGTSSNELTDLLDGDFSVWSLAANLLQPIFQGGRIKAQIAQKQALRDQAFFDFASKAFQAYAEVESTLVSEQLYRDRLAALDLAFQASKSAYEQAQDRYRSGLGDYTLVLEAERRFIQTETDWIMANRTLLENRVQLIMALGGGFPGTSAWAKGE